MKFKNEKIGIYLANGFEYYDLAVYSAIQSYIAVNFFPETAFGSYGHLLAWAPFILRFISRPFGGFAIGLYADRHGRKAALVLTSALTGLATVTMALLPTYEQIGLWAPLLFFCMQLIQAAAFGGEFPTAISYLIENTKPTHHARVGANLGVWLLIFIILPLIIVSITESILTKEDMIDFGWRVPILIGIINIGMSYYFKIKLTESRNIKLRQKVNVSFISIIKIFLIFTPNTILFYSNTVSNKILIKAFTDDPSLQSHLPIAFNLLFAIICYIIGYATDKYSNVKNTMKYSYGFMIISAVPIYALQALGNLTALIISQFFIALFIGVTLSGTPASVYSCASSSNTIANIGIGINLAAALIGASIPLAVNILSSYHPAYVGLLMSLGGLAYFIALALSKDHKGETALYPS